MIQTVSVIIPFFNAEKTLNRCINSVIEQTYQPLDIILINDGSTDKSVAVARRFLQRDKRITLINQANSGVSRARNRGISLAKGKYIQFVDADDFLEQQMIETLVRHMKGRQDLVLCGYKHIVQRNEKQFVTLYKPHRTGILDKQTVVDEIGRFYETTILQSPCNKLYSLHTIKKYAIQFKPQLQLGEDLLFNLDYLAVSESIYIVKDSFYNYTTEQADSLSRQFITDYLDKQVILHKKLMRFLQSHNAYYGENKRLIERKFTDHIMYSIALLCHPKSPHSRTQQIQEIKSLVNKPMVQKYLYHFNNSLQAKIVSFLMRKKLYYLLYCFFKMKHMLRRKSYPLFKYLQRVNHSIVKGSDV